MKSDGVVRIRLGRLAKFLRHLALGVAQNDARLAFSLACACIDIASSSADGIKTSFTSTEITLMPMVQSHINDLLQVHADLSLPSSMSDSMVLPISSSSVRAGLI